MVDVKKSYDAATQKILARADKIDTAVAYRAEVPYSLHEIVVALRKLYANTAFRNKFFDRRQFNDVQPWAKGMCALSSACVYELYGGAAVWEPMAIKMGQWEHGTVVFLRERSTGLIFDATGDQFVGLTVPYEIGQPINKPMSGVGGMKKIDFIKRVKKELDKR